VFQSTRFCPHFTPAQCCDPVMIAAFAASGASCGAKVCPKTGPHEGLVLDHVPLAYVRSDSSPSFVSSPPLHLLLYEKEYFIPVP
jgi:hypothetical protein